MYWTPLLPASYGVPSSGRLWPEGVDQQPQIVAEDLARRRWIRTAFAILLPQ